MTARRRARAGARRTDTASRKRSRAAVRRGPVVVVGLGRLGGALALGLERAGWPIRVLPRSRKSARRAAALGLETVGREGLREAKLCVLAVPDVAVGSVARELHEALEPTCALVHCAGALDLLAFGDQPELLARPRGSFHPLCAISSPEDALEGHTVALAATSPALLAVLGRMARDLRLRPIEVPETKRAAYHAGAVLSAGGLVALASAAVEALGQAGIGEAAALEALLPLMRSALRGAERRGLAAGLTGPIARGDVAVVEAHLAALPREVRELYRALGRRALALAGERLAPDVHARMARALQS